MYDLINELMGHTWTTGDSSQQYVYYIAGALIIVLTAVILDTVCRVFYHYLRGGR